jgi:acyl-CoA thioesterase
MDMRSFLGLEATHNRFRWKLPITPGIATEVGFLFGGVGLAAAIAAMEDVSGRPCVWATGQYLAFAPTGGVLDIDVRIAASGHQTTQARAVCHVADQEILTVNAALGSRPFDRAAQFETMPTGVPGPDDCAERDVAHFAAGTVFDRFDQRVASGRTEQELDGTPNDGRTRLWVRMPELDGALDAVGLAILGDFVPYGVSQALGIRGYGNSLDNTLRIVDPVPTDWVLIDIMIQAVERGFGHGMANLFAADGRLLATASQSCIVRYRSAFD